MASIKELSERVASNTALVDKWLAAKGAKPLSFEQDAEGEFPSTVGNPEIEAARMAILDDSATLHDLISGPGEVMRRVCWTPVDAAVQQCIYHFKFLQSIPLDGGATYAELSTRVGLPEMRVRAIVRQSATNRILYEDSPDHVVHTASSALLLRSSSMMNWYGLKVEEGLRILSHLAEALEKFNGSTAPQDCALSLAFNSSVPLFEWLKQDPDRYVRFSSSMKGMGGQSYGYNLDHVVNGYPWAELKDATVVDMGGSSGHMSVALAKAYPNLTKVVVQDYKDVVEQGALQLPHELSDRVSFEAHDFFTPQHREAADVYIMRHILHDWSDRESTKILQQIVPAMKPESKILLVEVVVLPSNMADSRLAERNMRNLDLTMIASLNAQERSKAEWEQVVQAAHPNLRVSRISKPKGSWDSIIEISLTNE